MNDTEKARLGLPLWKSEPRSTVKDQKKKATEKQRRDSYLLIEKRDGMRCRCCGKLLVRTLELRLDKLEHHHVNGRDVKDAEGTWNLACVCRECHDKRHVTRTLQIKGDANAAIRMKEGKKTWTTKPIKGGIRGCEPDLPGWREFARTGGAMGRPVSP